MENNYSINSKAAYKQWEGDAVEAVAPAQVMHNRKRILSCMEYRPGLPLHSPTDLRMYALTR